MDCFRIASMVVTLNISLGRCLLDLLDRGLLEQYRPASTQTRNASTRVQPRFNFCANWLCLLFEIVVYLGFVETQAEKVACMWANRPAQIDLLFNQCNKAPVFRVPWTILVVEFFIRLENLNLYLDFDASTLHTHVRESNRTCWDVFRGRKELCGWLWVTFLFNPSACHSTR